MNPCPRNALQFPEYSNRGLIVVCMRNCAAVVFAQNDTALIKLTFARTPSVPWKRNGIGYRVAQLLGLTAYSAYSALF